MKAEEHKYRLIVAIAAMFDNVYPLLTAIKLLQRFYKLERKMPKAC